MTTQIDCDSTLSVFQLLMFWMRKQLCQRYCRWQVAIKINIAVAVAVGVGVAVG